MSETTVLPLMPGSEPVEIKYEAPKPAQGFNPSFADEAYSGGALPGCDCGQCRRAREQSSLMSTTREVMIAQYGGAPTGRSVNWNPQIQELPRARPQAIDPAWILGRYDFTNHSGGPVGLHGSQRWLDPQTGQCYDNSGRRQWTFDRVQAGWECRQRVRFVPDSAPPPPMPVFNWDETISLGDQFDLQSVSRFP